MRGAQELIFFRKQIMQGNERLAIEKFGMEDVYLLIAIQDLLKHEELHNEYAIWTDMLQDVYTGHFATTTQVSFRRERFVIEKFGSIEAYVKWHWEKISN